MAPKFNAATYRELTKARETAIAALLADRQAELDRYAKLTGEHETALAKIDADLGEWDYTVSKSRKGQGDNKGVSVTDDILAMLASGPMAPGAITKGVHDKRKARGADPVEDTSIRSSLYGLVDNGKVEKTAEGSYQLAAAATAKAA